MLVLVGFDDLNKLVDVGQEGVDHVGVEVLASFFLEEVDYAVVVPGGFVDPDAG